MFDGNVAFLGLSPDDRRFAVGARDGRVALGRLGDAELEVVGELAGGWMRGSFSPDGRLLIAGSDRGDVKVWDIESRVLLDVLKHDEGVMQCEVVKPGVYTTMDFEGVIRIWRAKRKGEPEISVCDIGDPPVEFALDRPAGNLVLASALDWTIWSMDERRFVQKLKARTPSEQAASDGLSKFSKNGKFYFIHYDEAFVFAVESEQPVRQWARTVDPVELCVSDDGTRTAAATRDSRIVIQDLGETICDLKAGENEIELLDMTPDGTMVSFVDSAGGHGVFEAQTGKALLISDK